MSWYYIATGRSYSRRNHHRPLIKSICKQAKPEQRVGPGPKVGIASRTDVLGHRLVGPIRDLRPFRGGCARSNATGIPTVRSGRLPYVATGIGLGRSSGKGFPPTGMFTILASRAIHAALVARRPDSLRG